ncbi:MAG: DoxX family membrane protein [Opitutus sp.]
MRVVLAIFFIAAGINHFRDPELYLGMMPTWVPWPGACNVISGVGEIAGGIGILIPRLRRLAGCGLILLLIAVFPANVQAALVGHIPGMDVSPLALWLRLPFQPVFIGVVWWIAIWRPVTGSQVPPSSVGRG